MNAYEIALKKLDREFSGIKIDEEKIQNKIDYVYCENCRYVGWTRNVGGYSMAITPVAECYYPENMEEAGYTKKDKMYSKKDPEQINELGKCLWYKEDPVKVKKNIKKALRRNRIIESIIGEEGDIIDKILGLAPLVFIALLIPLMIVAMILVIVGIL